MAVEPETHTSAPSYTKHLDRPRNRMKIIRRLMDGATDDQLAEELGVHRTSVLRFRERHAAEIEELTDRFLAEAGDYIISDKRTRIADYDEMRTLLRGLATREPEHVEQTRYGEKKRPNPAFDAWLKVDQQAALELDQLPRAGLNITNQNLVVVKQVRTQSGNPELDPAP